MILKVIVYHKSNPEIAFPVYALLDEASDTTFVKTSVMEKLGVGGVDTYLILSTMLGREEIPISRMDGLVVQRIDGRVQVELPRTFTRDQIPDLKLQTPGHISEG